MATYFVSYYEITGREKKHLTGACFSATCYSKIPDRILYNCSVDQSLTPEVVKFYCEFLVKILGKHFSYHRSKNRMFWRLKLKGKGFNKGKALLYLTAFRYLDEYPDIVSYFYNHREKYPDLESLFEFFQIIHINSQAYPNPEPKLMKFNNLGGHGLMYEYYWSSSNPQKKVVSLKQFQTNLTGMFGQVHNYFREGNHILESNTKPVEVKPVENKPNPVFIDNPVAAYEKFDINKLKRVHSFVGVAI